MLNVHFSVFQVIFVTSISSTCKIFSSDYYNPFWFMTSLLKQPQTPLQIIPPDVSYIDSSNQRLSHSLIALFYKSATLYKKNYCSNICQLLTPIICIAFTIAVRILSQRFTTGSVGNFAFVQPFHLPIVSRMIPGMKIHCQERYYYSVPNASEEASALSGLLFSKVLKNYCSQSQKLQPEFIITNDTNNKTLEMLIEADREMLKRGVDLTTPFPDGTIKMHNISKDMLNSTITINDWRLPQYHKNNGVTKLDLRAQDQMIVSYLRVTEGLMSLIEKITRSYLQIFDEKQIIAGSYMYMPFEGQDKSLMDKMSNVLGSGLYPLGLSMLIPIILYGIVSQKEQKLIEIMKMNGLLMRYYWINFFLFNNLVSLLSCGLLYLMGRYVFQIIFFINTGWEVIWVLFVGWSVAQVSLTAFMQIFINSSKAATIIGYLLSIFSTIVGQAICTVIFPFPMKLPIILQLYPPLALSRGVYLIGNSCANNSSCFKSIINMNEQMYTVYFSLFAWIFMFVLSMYLHEMVHQQYGTSKIPPFIQKLFTFCKKQTFTELELPNSNQKTVYKEVQMEQQSLFTPNIDNQQQNQKQQRLRGQLVDESVLRLAQQTQSLGHSDRPLIIKNLEKTYENGFKALRANSFSLEQKQIFGLLGPNGAGKTTLISVLTGLYDASSGNAWIDSKQIGSEQANISLGVCPQFDLLWQNLTISEHMYFYALLKGVNINQTEQKINELLKDVDLLEQRDKKSSQLSGGMRRRLSLAIALTGNPRVVILDEPSSGLDPSHRRQMWDILLKCKKRTTIILTTHLMQQAQALCDRIGIIDKGLLRCVGTQKQLKQKFGKGYRLTVNFKQWKGEKESVLTTLMQSGCQLVNDLQSRIMVKVPKQNMLQCVRKMRKIDSLHWLLSQPSLYDVFIHFIN